MAESSEKERRKWTTTIIISSSLKSCEIAVALENQSHKIRYSDTLESGSVVFSLSAFKNHNGLFCKMEGPERTLTLQVPSWSRAPDHLFIWLFIWVAFLLMDAKECITSPEEIFLTKIEKFISIHKNSFLVLSAPLHGPEEWKLMFRIQQRFLGSSLRILPVHNTANAINLMCTIAKTTSKPNIDNICYRMITTKAYIIEQSPVWKTLQKMKLSPDSINPDFK